jgi:4-aminobutyrate aminotransferase-like enzyme
MAGNAKFSARLLTISRNRPPWLDAKVCPASFRAIFEQACLMSRERPNDLGAFWMPFTPNRDFKSQPRMLARAEGMCFYDEDGRALLDACSGLWCSNLGHGRKEIAEAISKAAHHLDFAPTFQFSHPPAFELASRIAALAPEGLDHVFFVNSGSEAADSALKLARAYWQKKGQGGRFRLIGRDKGYHGVNFGGISVGGLANNRKPYGPLLPGTDDHLPLPYDRATMAFTRGHPEKGADYADALDGLVALHGAETIAAVIVEPMSGSAGVFAPPKDYLKRLRAACDRHNILLIFDEVITGFGRVGARALWCDAGHHHLCQGRDQRRRANGRYDREQHDSRSLHARPRARHRAVPRQYLFRPSAGLRRGPRIARSVSRRESVHACTQTRNDV